VQATPVLVRASSDMTLADLWEWFEQPSLFGLPVRTTGSTLGESVAFFVPLLSAMRLYTSCGATASSPAPAQPGQAHARCKAHNW
jgi:Protein of unknown function (DUF789)